MLKRSRPANLGLVFAALTLPCLASSVFAAQAGAEKGCGVSSCTPGEKAAKADATPESVDISPAPALEKSEPKPAASGGLKGAGPADPPSWYRRSVKKKGDSSETDDTDPTDDSSVPIDAPSVAEGKKAGIEVGDFAPDFELQPVEPSADLKRWLGVDAPESVQRNVLLSKVVGKAPVLLLFGSYT